MVKDIMHKKVRIIANGKLAYVVWYSNDYFKNPEKARYMLDLADEDELPLFYERNEFELLEE